MKGVGHGARRESQGNWIMDIRARLEALAAAPRTHRVTMTYACGKVRTYDARSMREAQATASRESASIGKDKIERETGRAVRMVSVVVSAI